MGRTRTTVGTSVSRVIPDASLTNPVQTGVLRSLFQPGELVDEVLEELISSIGIRAERLYEYANRGSYTHGLPSGQFVSDSQGQEEVVAILEALEGGPVETSYVRKSPANAIHIGWIDLLANHAYNTASNELEDLSVTVGFPVYLKDMVVVVPTADLAITEPRSLEAWGIAARAGYTPSRPARTPETQLLVTPSGPQTDDVATDEYLLVTYEWREILGGPFLEDTFTIPLTGFNEKVDYFHARYTVGGVVKYWMYEDGLGTYPTLDEYSDPPTEIDGEFFPFMYFRYDAVSELENPTSPSYLTNKRLARYLGMDYDSLAEGIDANPDIADVRQAMMMFAVPAVTTNELERRYLWEFFNNLYLAGPNQFSSETTRTLFGLDNVGATAGLVIGDTRFKMAIANSGIYKFRKSGSIGEVGKHDSGVTTKTKHYETRDVETGFVTTQDYTVSVHYYRRQISTGFYDEIQVDGLKTLFRILDGYLSIANDSEDFLLIPVDHSITEVWSIAVRNTIYSRSMHYVFNSAITVKVAWYEDEFFQFIMFAAAVFMAFWTGGASLTELSGLLAAGNLVGAAILLGTMLLQYVIVSMLFKLFVKIVGVKAALVIAILAAMLSVGAQFDFSGLAGCPFAQDLLSLSTGLVSAIDAQVKSDVLDLVNQAKEFDLYKAAQIKLLETAQDLLDHKSLLNPFVIFGEKPGEYYDRTVHSGNIGIVGLDSIALFVESKLTLPRISEMSMEGA